MQCAVIVTYKCNARCAMCYIWKNPSRTSEELGPEHLESLPGNFRQIAISGGEPTLRKDLLEIAEVLHPKTRRLQIISNGTRPQVLYELAKRFPAMSFRLSVDGIGRLNDEIRGLADGFERCMDALARLRELGARDLGISMTVSDRNSSDLLPLYRRAVAMGVDFAQSVVHNSHYFHKDDNEIVDVEAWRGPIEQFREELLGSTRRSLRGRAKDWARAFIAHGYLEHFDTRRRLLPCRAGVDFFTIDPFGNVLPCNGMTTPMPMGNLKEQHFDAIWRSAAAREVRATTRKCENCWMICNAAPSMRRHPWKVAAWVGRSKLRRRLPAAGPRACRESPAGGAGALT